MSHVLRKRHSTCPTLRQVLPSYKSYRSYRSYFSAHDIGPANKKRTCAMHKSCEHGGSRARKGDSRPLRGGTFAARVLELHRDVLPGTETKWRYRNMPAGATRRRVGIKKINKIPYSQVRSTASAARTDGERGPRKIPRSPAANAAGTRAPWANPPSLKLRRAGGGDFLGIKILNPDNRNPLHLPDQ